VIARSRSNTLNLIFRKTTRCIIIKFRLFDLDLMVTDIIDVVTLLMWECRQA